MSTTDKIMQSIRNLKPVCVIEFEKSLKELDDVTSKTITTIHRKKTIHVKEEKSNGSSHELGQISKFF